MSCFKQSGETEDGVPVLVVLPEYPHCKLAKAGKPLRARTVTRGQTLVCPRCERVCEVPGSIGQGDEFVVIGFGRK
ncbi:hypothetical protein V6C53_17650 [Desulfocurvibacter africanus]|uniref:hypothetical protein n=1 Tax=Desulfocurvibacter africanus TaxID=873 RepID=UPI002FDAB9BA